MSLEGLLISVDGTEEVHNEIRGSADSYQRLMQGVAEITRLKRARKSALPYIVFLLTVSRDNVHELDKVFEIAEAADVHIQFH